MIPHHVIATVSDYFTRRVDPEVRVRQLTLQLVDLGFEVTSPRPPDQRLRRCPA